WFFRHKVSSQDSSFQYGSLYLQGESTAGTIAGYQSFSFDDPVQRVTSYLPLHLGPPWFAAAVDSQGLVEVAAAIGKYFDAFRDQGNDVPVAPSGQVEWGLAPPTGQGPTGVLPQSLAALYRLPLGYSGRPTAFTLRLEVPPYSVGGLAGRSRFTATFDSRRPDGNPPTLRRFALESGGRSTDTVGGDAPLSAAIEAGDTAPVSAILHPPDGDLPLLRQPDGRLAVTLANPCGGTTGGVSLGLTVTDASGNAIDQEWHPAFACMAATC